MATTRGDVPTADTAYRVELPCPFCQQSPTLATHRHFSSVALFCPKCENAWNDNVETHLVLALIPETFGSRF